MPAIPGSPAQSFKFFGGEASRSGEGSQEEVEETKGRSNRGRQKRGLEEGAAFHCRHQCVGLGWQAMRRGKWKRRAVIAVFAVMIVAGVSLFMINAEEIVALILNHPRPALPRGQWCPPRW